MVGLPPVARSLGVEQDLLCEWRTSPDLRAVARSAARRVTDFARIVTPFVLADEEDLARKRVKSLNETQRKKAVVDEKAPNPGGRT